MAVIRKCQRNIPVFKIGGIKTTAKINNTQKIEKSSVYEDEISISKEAIATFEHANTFQEKKGE